MAEASVSPEEFLAMGREVLAAQPFSRLIGAELAAFSRGHCELHVPIGESVKQQHGFVHGGVLSYAADNALTYAGGSALGVPVVTAEFKINYLRPAIGERLIARAEAVHTGKTQSVCRCDVFVLKDGAEKLCAVAQGTIAALPRQN
ncbi:PaaI family thioesterase [Hydrogenophaga sp. IBVHS1]|uniref:PaaI family thioesterase n=1 Tax=unclassified Hydrogenophaga TaxID=2610897 RepID=UPI000A2D90CA|nr:PaaI family thioesterase [Hydrogenophaga sp. IBVHS1]OSZ75329.1 phenylacetic acid degradation protein [Hydrogenophaga sp. IBVHS1]